MKKKKDDKRFRQRVPIEDKVQIVCDDMNKFMTEYADNISSGGMFIKTANPFPTGTRFNLELCIGTTGQKISGVGEVVWTKEFSSAGDKRPSGMGIRFVELHGTSKALIAELIEKSDG